MKSEVELVREAEQAIRRCLADVPFVQIADIATRPDIDGRQPDLVARLRIPTGETTLVIEVKSSGQPRIARHAVGQIADVSRDIPNAYGVFVAPYVSPRAAEICIEGNIGYVDLAGNCRLSFWPVYVRSAGAKNPFAEKRGLRSLYLPTSVKTTTILRVLLENPKRVWKTQELASVADASLGQVSNVNRQLQDREWLQRGADGFRLTDPVALLSDWSRHYDIRCNRIRDFYSMKAIPEIEAELAEACAQESIRYALTGFSGGARYAAAIRYQRVMAYIADGAVDGVADALSLREVPSGANVSLIAPYDASVLYGSRIVEGVKVASPVQVYLDLQSTRGRGEEAAEALLEGEIEPEWR